MFFSRAPVKIECRQLEINQKQLIKLAAYWYIDKWGYTEKDGDGKKHILKVLRDNSYKFYMVFLSGHFQVPVGMFSLSRAWEEGKDQYIIPGFENYYLLDDVYVDEAARSLGIAGKIVEAAKQISIDDDQTHIILATFSPNLNGFYKRKGAEVLSDVETSFNNYPTDTLVIKLDGVKTSLQDHPADTSVISLKK